jgi:transposase
MAARNSLGLSSLGPVAALELRCLLDQIEFLGAQIAPVEAAIEELMAQEERYLYLRRALWLAATSARRFNPNLQEHYERKSRAGKPYGIVMSAICRKLLARIYVVIREPAF